MMHKCHVVVEQVNIDCHDEELNYKSQEIADKALPILLEEVEIQFEQITILLLQGHVRDSDKHKVKHCKETVP